MRFAVSLYQLPCFRPIHHTSPIVAVFWSFLKMPDRSLKKNGWFEKSQRHSVRNQESLCELVFVGQGGLLQSLSGAAEQAASVRQVFDLPGHRTSWRHLVARVPGSPVDVHGSRMR